MKNNIKITLDNLRLYVDLVLINGLNLERMKRHAMFYDGILEAAGLTAEEASVKFKTGTVPFVIAKVISNKFK